MVQGEGEAGIAGGNSRICAVEKLWPEGFPLALLLISGIFFQSPGFRISSTGVGISCLTMTANSDYYMQSCSLLVLKRHDKKPDLHFYSELLHVSNRTGGPAKSRQEKSTVSSSYHFLICFPALIGQSDVKTAFAWTPLFPRAVTSLGK